VSDEEALTVTIAAAALLCWVLAGVFLFWPSRLPLESCGSVILPADQTGPSCGSMHTAQIGRAMVAALVSGLLTVCWLMLREPRRAPSPAPVSDHPDDLD
jgi:hypothetical protein